MGVKIGDLIEPQAIQVEDLAGQLLAFDAHNILFQFLTSIRQPDGTPLMDAQGRITSHLSGVFYRNLALMTKGIRPVYVFDGEAPVEKAATRAARRERREQAAKDYEKALAEGDLVTARSKAAQATRLTPGIITEVQDLLTAMGIPWVQAPGEGEAQASYLAAKGLVDGVVSSDYDTLLFGAPVLVRNLTTSGRRALPRGRYRIVEIERIHLADLLARTHLSRPRLVDLAILVGTDFHPGIKGIGPKKGLKLLQKHHDIEGILNNTDHHIKGYERIREIFLAPDVSDAVDLTSPGLDRERVIELMVEERGFSRDRVTTGLDRLAKVQKAKQQRSLDQWFG